MEKIYDIKLEDLELNQLEESYPNLTGKMKYLLHLCRYPDTGNLIHFKISCNYLMEKINLDKDVELEAIVNHVLILNKKLQSYVLRLILNAESEEFLKEYRMKEFNIIQNEQNLTSVHPKYQVRVVYIKQIELSE